MYIILATSATLACSFGCAWLGMIIRSRLPAHHLERESQDVVRLGIGLVATMTALLLGLIIADAKGSYDLQDAAIRNSAADILLLDRLLERYGPEAKSARDLLKETIAHRIAATWPSHSFLSPNPNGFAPGMGGEAIESRILDLVPTTDSERWIKTQALLLTQEVLKSRWGLLSTSKGSVPPAFLIAVIFWLAVTFASFGLFAPRNGTVVTVFFVVALSVAAAVFLILELDQPFSGLIRISSGPLRYALENLGK